MRRYIALLLTVALLFTFYGTALADTLRLPASLESIEREAFYGNTALDEVVVPYGTEYIKARAFADSSIKKIYIPETVTFIASNAFDGADDVEIHAPAGSYAEAFAEEHEYLWEPETIEYMEYTFQTKIDLYTAWASEAETEPLSLDAYQPIYIPTDGITDQELMDIIVKYNQREDRIAEQKALLNDKIGEISESLNQLGDSVSDVTAEVSDGKVSFNSGVQTYSIDGSGLELLGKDFEISSMSCSDDGSEMLMEFESNDSRFYLHCNFDGMTIAANTGEIVPKKAMRAMTVNQALPLLASQNNSNPLWSAVEKIQRQFERIQPIMTGFNTEYTIAIEIQDGIVENLTEQLNSKIALRDSGLLNQYGNPMVTPSEIESAERALKDATEELNTFKRIGKFFAGLDIVNRVANILSDSRKFFEVIAVYGHGHPTDAEASNPELSETAIELKGEITSALSLIGSSLLYNGFYVAEDIAAFVTKAGSFFPQVRVGGTAARIVIEIAFALFKEYVVEKGLETEAKKHYGKVKQLDEKLHGIATGKVTDKETGEPLKRVLVTSGSHWCYTNSTGWFTMSLTPGSHTLTFTKNGYKTEERTVVINALQSSLPCNVAMTSKGIITGKVIDASTAAALSGVTVMYGDYRTTTNANGQYTFEVKPGTALLTFEKTGYISGGGNATCEVGMTKVYDFAMAKKMPKGTYKAVLSWGISPSDLDSHLTGPNGMHVYYTNKSAENASLDVDDTTSYGPETITFVPSETGTYRYYIHDYTNRDNSSSKALSKSGAVVRVYRGDEQIGVYSVPASVGLTWTVFTITDGVYRAGG